MKFFKILFAASLLFSLAGCLETRDEINDMESGKQAQEQVSVIQRSRADDQSRILALQDELRAANGRLDYLEKKLSDTQLQVAQNEKAIKPDGPSNKDIIDQMKIFESNIAQLKTHVDDIEAKMTVISKNQAKEASSAVTSKDPWAAAEDAYGKKQWKTAILNYQAFRDQNTKSPNYSVATYKIGVCFQELKMRDEATAFFQEVIQKFPKSPSAKKAKFRLSQMK